MTENFKTKIKDQTKQLGIELTEQQIEQLFKYYEMMVEKNKVMNLTGITEENDVITKHIIDSLSIAKCVDPASLNSSDHKYKMIDIGTGAGLPGMILKIVFPNVEMTLFDSLKKRLVFLDEVIHELKLVDVQTVHGRAEDFGRDRKFREQYDFAVSRAVANMSSLSEYCIPFVKKGGSFIAYKSADSHEEIEAAKPAIKKLGAKIKEETVFMLPGSDIERRMLVIEKISNTSMTYPRKAGIPSKDPLK